MDEKRHVFKAMAAGMLEGGFLRYSQRQELLRFAQQLGIAQFEAALLIAQVQYLPEEPAPLPSGEWVAAPADQEPERLSDWSRLSLALTAAIAVDLLAIWLLF